MSGRSALVTGPALEGTDMIVRFSALRTQSVEPGIATFIASACLALSLCAQQPDFDVAYIKPNPGWPPMTVGPGFNAHGVGGSKVTLRNLVMLAYDVTAPRVIGPGWLDGNRFDIIATAPEGTAPAELRVMLQDLLKQRFHLRAHMETRDMPVYDLVVARNGVKMVGHPAPAPVGPAVPRDAYPGVTHLSTLRGSGQTTTFIAEKLSGMTDRPVLDKTGLDGTYDYFLIWLSSVSAASNEVELGPPDLFTAIEQQLGLTLRPTKAQLTVVVVDQADQIPTEN
jgi:bla regulator protein BlaR1